MYSDEFGDYEAALADLDRAIELDPEYAEALNNRGSVYNRLEDWERAIADFDRALEIAEFPLAYYNRAYAHLRLGEDQQAIADYTRAIELYPPYPQAYHERGTVYQRQSDYEAAIADYIMALELGYDNTGDIRDRALSIIARGEEYLDDLLALYDLLVELTPWDAETYYCRALVHDEKGDVAEAITDYEKFLELRSEEDSNTVNARERIEALSDDR
jgi:tetratricopeptide (TPR) repeat protein